MSLNAKAKQYAEATDNGILITHQNCLTLQSQVN